MAYQKYLSIPNRRGNVGDRDHFQHIENALSGVVPGPGEVIVGTPDGPVATPVEEIGGDPNAVIGTGVRRIIASFDPNHPLEDGDLLVLLEWEGIHTDFSDYNPADWSQPWATSATWTVVDEPTATGGKVLRATGSETSRSVLAWDAIGDGGSADVDVAVRWRTSNIEQGSIKVVVRGSGPSGAENGYWGARAYSSATTARINRYLNNARITVSSGDHPMPPNVWINERFRVNGSNLMWRTWLDGDDEPSTWNLTGTDTGITDPGFVGLFLEGSGTADIDVLGVAFGGDTAPLMKPGG